MAAGMLRRTGRMCEVDDDYAAIELELDDDDSEAKRGAAVTEAPLQAGGMPAFW